LINFDTFDQWHSVAGFMAIAFFLIIYPVNKEDSFYLKSMLILGVILIIMFPFIVEVTTDKETKMLLSREAKIVQMLTFILLFYCYLNKEKLFDYIPNFFWYCYLLGCFCLLERCIVDVLLNGNYQFYKTIFPFLKDNFGIKDFNFTAPPNYLIKFIFLSLFFRDLFQDPLKKHFFKYLMYALVVFELVMVFVFKSYQGYDSLSSTVKNVFILGSTGLFMYKLYRADSHGIILYKNPYFWLTLGFMLPALAEIFLEFIFTKLYQTDLLSFYKYYLIRNASQIVGFTLLIVGVWQAKYLRFLPKEY
jgi:hypothetical protein